MSCKTFYFKSLCVVSLSVIAGSATSFAQSGSNILKIKDQDQLQEYCKYTGKDLPLISGHRGGTTKGYPENCIATFENTLRNTPAFFEVDPRLTKDSVVILMHDATLDRTTTGTGKISDYTWEELQKFRLKDPEGNVTEYKIPRMIDVIKWSKGKTFLNLDEKDVPFEMTARIIKECKNTVIMLTVHNAKEAKFYYDRNPKQMFSAFMLTKKAIGEYEALGIPWKNMIAYIGPTVKPENKEIQDILHQHGVMCMISAAPSYDKLKDADERANSYREVFKSGADILESDLPIEVSTAITATFPTNSPKQRFWGKL